MAKLMLPSIILLMLITCSASNHPAVAKSNTLMLTGDSGFVTKNEGLRFLLSHKLTAMKESSWDLIKDADTIGKYYKVKESGNYFLCLIDYSSKYTFETHVLLELTPTGKLIKSQRLFHNNYACCWDNYYEGFNKTGDYFSVAICGTGLGYCGSRLYLFKDIVPYDLQDPIPSYYSMIYEDRLESMTSTMEFKNGQLLMHYSVESGSMDDNGNYNIDSTKCFDATFYFKNNKWKTADSALFEGMPIW